MRIRALVLGFLFAALSARAATVRVVRFDAKFTSGEHSALCVVPGEVQDSAAARYICYFVIPGKGKIRDNTRAGSFPQPVEQSDPYFTVWLKARLPAGNGCVLSAIAGGSGFPARDALEVFCPDLEYQTGATPAGTSETFMDDVHKAVEAALPMKVEEVASTAAAPATTLATTDTESPAETATTKTDDGPIADTKTDTGPSPHAPANTGTAIVEKKTFTFDWQAALLILIGVLMTFVAAERVVAIVQRWLFLKRAFAGEELLHNARNLADAATILHNQREDARASLVASLKKTEEVEKTLATVAGNLDARKGEDRAARAAALVSYEKTLLRLAGDASAAPAALVAIETRLNERKKIENLLGKSDNIVDTVRDQVALVTACSVPFWGRAKTADIATVAIQEVESGVYRLYRSIDRPGPNEPDAKFALNTIQQALDKLREQQKTIDSQQRTLGAVRGFMTSQWPDAVSDDLDSTVSKVAQQMRDARARATSIERAADRGADAVITELATLVESERRVAHEAHEILVRLRDYLALPDGDAESLRKIIVAELGTPKRTLRLVLAAALPAIGATLDRLTGEEEARVVRMLALSELHMQLTSFLRRIHTYDDAQLWKKGLEPGFSQQWLHYLFRAEAVLRTYFMASSLAELAEMLMAISWAFRHAIATVSGYEVDRIQLLSELPATMNQMHVNPRELQSCPDISSRVKTTLKARGDGGFTIDVDTIGLRNSTEVLWRSGLVLANRHDWEG